MWVSNKIIILEIQYEAPSTYNIVNFSSPFKIKMCGHWDYGTSFQLYMSSMCRSANYGLALF